MADPASTSSGKEKKSELVKAEEKTLAFWKDNKIFEKTLAKKSPKKNFVFFDGPPFATGLPHYGHLLTSIIKDVIPRLRTMQGYKVDRLWGWDCHGLPIENLIEEKLGLNQKSDIEKFGIEKFNEEARTSVLEYGEEWQKIIPRVGRWIEMKESYRTMDWTYTESIWWAFKTLYDKNLVYEGYKSMHLCPRCETTLAVSEVAEGYKDIVDISVYVKFALVGEKDTFLLAWTTTPWTLPGNVALVVGSGIEYARVKVKNKNTAKNEIYIIGKEKLSVLEKNYELLGTVLGEDLIGKSYLPPFDYYYKDNDLEYKENGWKVYPASFVNVEEGTGIVHIAPAFGEDDLALSRERGLPFVQHIATDGRFKEEVEDFKGLQVKPKDDHQKIDIEIIKYLAQKNLLYKKEKLTHSYPHCWRCETPLLNYAASSWFVNVISLKEKLIATSKRVEWVPHHIKNGRFGKWLLGARDWAVSRSRFWGAPLPVWKCAECEHVEVIGSIREIKEKGIPARNTYTIMRHGEALSNRLGVVNGVVDQRYSLTEKGKKQVKSALKKLREKDIDIVISSPLPRTQETAEIVAQELNLSGKNSFTAEHLKEVSFGQFEGRQIEKYHAYFENDEEKCVKNPPGGENYTDVQKRVMEFLYSLEARYDNKHILLISHDTPLYMLGAGVEGMSGKRAFSQKEEKGFTFIKNAEFRTLSFTPLPHNTRSFEIDLHRPYIDKILLRCSCGGEMERIKEVFDCWFESGSMPYARFHYPFENKKQFNNNFPADFIAEGLDQTRGWFYNMFVLSVGLFGVSPFKNVIVNGLILAEDGQKMSKRLKNYPESKYILNKYGADALRLYLLSSPVVRGENLHFSEKGVREVQNKVITRLRNVYSFYELYREYEDDASKKQMFIKRSGHVLDEWILVRLNELKERVGENLESYELDKAIRPFLLFIEDLSVWYLRRSRERFKGEDVEDKKAALGTTRFVLLESAKLLAPFAPFVAEEIYQRLRDDFGKRNTCESVHLERWPKSTSHIPVWPNPMALFHRIFKTHKDLNVLRAMEDVREIVSLALEARSFAGVKVRQPLKTLFVKKKYGNISANENLVALICDEVNIKEVIFNSEKEEEILLDLTITESLRREGILRELIRCIQDLRKKKNLNPKEKASLSIKTDKKGKELIGAHVALLKEVAELDEISYDDAREGEEVVIDGISFTFRL